MSLEGKTIAITRGEREAAEFSRLAGAAGGRAIALPTIEIVPKGRQAAEEFLDKLRKKRHDYCAFMSPQAVGVLFDLASKDEIVAALGSAKVIAVGPKTSQSLQERGVKVGMVPEKFSSAGLAELLSGADPAGKKIIIPRSGAANEFATEALAALGMEADEIFLYDVRTSLPPAPVWSEFAKTLKQKKVDAVVFTSASSVNSFFEIMSMISPSSLRLDYLTMVVSIGPFTSKELHERGIHCFEAKEHTVRGAFEEAARQIV